MSALPVLASPDGLLWEARGAWASGRRVAASLMLEGHVERLEGHVSRVAATGAFVVLAGTHVPTGVLLAVHHPSRLGDSTYREDPERPFLGRARRHVPQREELF